MFVPITRSRFHTHSGYIYHPSIQKNNHHDKTHWCSYMASDLDSFHTERNMLCRFGHGDTLKKNIVCLFSGIILSTLMQFKACQWILNINIMTINSAPPSSHILPLNPSLQQKQSPVWTSQVSFKQLSGHFVQFSP